MNCTFTEQYIIAAMEERTSFKSSINMQTNETQTEEEVKEECSLETPKLLVEDSTQTEMTETPSTSVTEKNGDQRKMDALEEKLGKIESEK